MIEERRKRVYTMLFDDGRRETVEAHTPSEAVAAREGGKYAMLPYQINDDTAIAAWIEALHRRNEKRHEPLTPVYTGKYGEGITTASRKETTAWD